MKKILNYFKENKLLFISLSIAVLCMYSFFIFFNRPFALNNDQWLQYKYFYKEWINLLNNIFEYHTLPMWSWNAFLGNNFLAAQTYYVTGDLFLPLYYLINNLDIFLLLESILCIYISGILMNLFLCEFGIKNIEGRNFISICYAISGFATLFIGQYMFHRFYAFMPLLFYGIERLFNKKKGDILSIAVFILFLQCYYLMFPLTILLPFYCIFSLNKKGIRELKIILLYALKVIGYYLLGFTMSLFLVLPAILSLLQNQRVGTNNYDNILFKYKDYMGLVLNWGSNFLERGVFESIFYSGDQSGHLSSYSFYIGGLPFLGTFTLLFSKDWKKYVILLIPFIILCIPSLNSIVHAFSVPTMRWSFVIVFYALVLSAIFFDEKNDIKQLVKSLRIYSTIYIALIIIGIITSNIEFSKHQIHFYVLIVYLLLMVFTVLLYKKSKRVAIIVTICSLIMSSVFIVYFLNRDFNSYEEDLDRDVLQYVKDEDDDKSYRIYIDTDILNPGSVLNLNQSLNYGYMSTSSYNTMYEYVVNPFLNDIGIKLHIINIKDPEITKLLGCKYYIAYDENELPQEEDFEFVTNINHLCIYKRKDYKKIGFTYNNFIHRRDVDFDDHDWLNTLIVSDEYDYSKYISDTNSIGFITESMEPNMLKGNITIEEPSILFFSIPNCDGWKIFVDGEIIQPITVNDGFIGIELTNSGYHEIQLSFVTPGLKAGLILSAIAISGWILLVILEKKKML